MGGDEVHYSEPQSFRQWWIWTAALLGPVVVLCLGLNGFVDNFVRVGTFFTWYPVLLFGVGALLGIVISCFLLYMRLDVEVRQTGLFVRFRPLHIDWIMFPFEEIESAKRVQYNPLREYGGWGIRHGKGAKAYNVSGNHGVMIRFVDGRHILIGSQSPDALEMAIARFLFRTEE